MTLFDYQNDAVAALVKGFKELLYGGRSPNQIVFKAPTGSGKTVMVASMLEQLLAEDIGKECVFIWACKGILANQSYEKLSQQYLQGSAYSFMRLGDLSAEALPTNTVMFISWEKIFRSHPDDDGEIVFDNVAVRIGETGKNLQNVMNLTREAGKTVILIVDEAHSGLMAPSTRRAVETIIQPKMSIEVSATPQNMPSAEDIADNCARLVKVGLVDVVASGTIKKYAKINSNISEHVDGETADTAVISAALATRMILLERYIVEGTNIKPLILIQLPTESAKTSEADVSMRETVENYLRDCGITYDNHKLAIWLSDDKTNKELVDIPDSPVEVLIFKQAIALGWDCPRAQILIMLRAMRSITFETQTVGRIMRMPELHHYDDDALNVAYVYTNIASVIVAQDDDTKLYFPPKHSHQRPGLRNIVLPNSYFLRADRKRLGGEFRDILIDQLNSVFEINDDDSAAIRQQKLATKLDIADEELTVRIPSDTVVDNLDDIDKLLIETIPAGVDRPYVQRQFDMSVKSWVKPYAPHDSAPVLKSALYKWFNDNGFRDEYTVQKIMTCANESAASNQIVLSEIIEIAKNEYCRDKGEFRVEKNSAFFAPVEQEFGEDYIEVPMEKHALIPYYRHRGAHNPEVAFEQYLDSHGQVEWWFRNGISQSKYFGVVYTDESTFKDWFYPDYIVRFTDGTVGIFDTKGVDSTANPDSEQGQRVDAKANALQNYLRANAGLHVWGGIVVSLDNKTDWLIQSDAITHEMARQTLDGSEYAAEPADYKYGQWVALDI